MNRSRGVIYKGQRGPCNNCGIESTSMWRNGPVHKPRLCNACGTRWYIYGHLKNYIPRHGFAIGYAIERDTKETGSSSSSSGIVQPNEWASYVPRRKRSNFDQSVLPTVVKLHRQLKRTLDQPEFSYLLEEPEMLIMPYYPQMCPGEIGLGCVLLTPPYSTKE